MGFSASGKKNNGKVGRRSKLLFYTLETDYLGAQKDEIIAFEREDNDKFVGLKSSDSSSPF